MPDYAITAANVRASVNATRFIPNPAFVLKGEPSVVVPNVCLAGVAVIAGQGAYQGTDDLFYPANAIQPAAQTVGSLIVGKRYTITTFVAGDNFTNVGAAANATGTIFTATGTTPTTWTNGSTLNATDAVYKAVGVFENSAAKGQPVSIVTKDPLFTPGCTLAIGDVGIVSATDGGITEVANRAATWRISALWVAFSTTQANLNIVRSDEPRA